MKNNLKTSIYTVARQAGVSPGTVSMVLNNNPKISTETRQNVIRVMQELRFTPKKRIPKIGLLVSGFSGLEPITYVARMLALLMREFSRLEYLVKIIDENELDILNNHEFDGLLSIMYRDHAEEIMKQTALPLLTINNPSGQHLVHEIGTDHEQGATLATEYLIQHGHRNILFLEYDPAGWGAIERTRGYRKTLQKHGIDQEMIGYTKMESYANLIILAQRKGCTAIINFAENTLMQVPHFLSHVLQLRIPEDISLITEELPGVSELLSPPLTTIKQPMELMVKEAIDEFSLILSGNRKECLSRFINNELIERNSVATIS